MVGLRRCRPRLNTARGGEMRLDTCRALSPQVVAAGGMASSGAREPVEDPASKVLITSSVADSMPFADLMVPITFTPATLPPIPDRSVAGHGQRNSQIS